MKNMRKIASLLLALAMVFSLAISASAATVTNSTNHPYKAYQIFTGTQADGSAALGDVEWGDDIDSSEFLNALQSDDRFKKDETNIFASCTTAMDVAEALAANKETQSYALAFANVAAANLKTDATPVDIAAEATTTNLDAGYYLLVDSSTTIDEGDAKNSALLQVTNEGNITIDKKYTVPAPDKDITGVTHLSTKTSFTGSEAVDAEFGDIVEFTLTGTLPSNYDDYEKYVYKFHDTLSTGLEYVANSAEVYVVNGETSTKLETGFTVSTTGCGNEEEDGCKCNLSISCDNLKAITGATINKDSKIKVVYSAKLTGTATIGEPGIPNTMYIEYSNNPNQTGDGASETGHTPEDRVVVFTYELDVTKIDGKTPAEGETAPTLSGAQFVLLSSDQNKVAKVTDGKLTEWVDVPTAGENNETTWDNASILTSGQDGKFVIKGLDSGTYKLREIKAPAGYNLLTEDVTIVITATITSADDQDPDLTELKIQVDNGTATDGAKKDDGSYTGILAATVENNAGSTLPETGGVGTTMFYVIGGILVLAAVVLLVTKKRMRSAE